MSDNEPYIFKPEIKERVIIQELFPELDARHHRILRNVLLHDILGDDATPKQLEQFNKLYPEDKQ